MICIQDDGPPILEDRHTPPSDPAPEYSAEPTSKLDEVQPTPSAVEVTSSEEDFPIQSLNALDEQLNRPKWVVPVRPDDELEKLLKASIRLCRKGELRCL